LGTRKNFGLRIWNWELPFRSDLRSQFEIRNPKFEILIGA